MKPPKINIKQVRIGPLVYRVSTDPLEHERYCEREGKYYFGWTDHQYLTINLDPHLPLPQLQDTLLHEVEHAIWWASGLRRESLENLTQEDIICRTNTYRLDVLQRNPQMVDFLRRPPEGA